MTINTEIKLGNEVEDKITGFRGVVTGLVAYITGCNQALVTPKCIDNDLKAPEWFDEGRLEIVNSSVVEVESTPTGWGKPAPKK